MSEFVSLPEDSIATSSPIIPMDYSGDSHAYAINRTSETKPLIDIRTIKKVAGYELKWPLWILLYKTEELIIAEELELGLWSDGDDIEEAIEGVIAFFRHEYLEYLKTSDDEMDLLARQEKAKFLAWVK